MEKAWRLFDLVSALNRSPRAFLFLKTIRGTLDSGELCFLLFCMQISFRKGEESMNYVYGYT